MLRKIILAAVAWGLVATVSAQAQVQPRAANGGAPSGMEARKMAGKGLFAKKGKKKKKEGNRGKKHKKHKKHKKGRGRF